ncbi:hypothetical protein NE865_14485 [Phthorimaea operculella]|nr:hypothetical protein NE865_14485 [Phthorimaea operculella]
MAPSQLICASCLGDISDDINYIKCTAEHCRKYYHLDPLCMGGPLEAQGTDKSKWACPKCKASARRPPGDYSSSPVGSKSKVSFTPEETINVTIREKKNAPTLLVDNVKPRTPNNTKADTAVLEGSTKDVPLADAVSSLANEIFMLRSDIFQLKSELTTTQNSLKICTARLGDITDKLTESDKRLKLLEERDAEVSSLKSQVQSLQEQLNQESQATLGNEVEITGIPERKEENLIHVAMLIGTKVGVRLEENDIDFAVRVGPKQSPAGSSNPQGQKGPLNRPVVLRMVRRDKRDEFLKQAKARKNVTTKDLQIGAGEQNNKVYVNERLCRAYRQLFRATRQRAEQANYKYYWTKNGCIYVRKTDNSPAIRIRSQVELEEKIVLQQVV